MENISKSSRHSHITGSFAEALVLYWLSRNGFECARIDHTGIDLIARNCYTDECMGISVKSRSRYKGTESGAVSCAITDYKKIDSACATFNCIAYHAIVVDTGNCIRMYLLTTEHFRSVAKAGSTKSHWGMTVKHLERYRNDPAIKTVELAVSAPRWWGRAEGKNLRPQRIKT